MIKLLIVFLLENGMYEMHLSRMMHPSKEICIAREKPMATAIAKKVIKEQATHKDFAVGCLSKEEYLTIKGMMDQHNVKQKKKIGLQV